MPVALRGDVKDGFFFGGVGALPLGDQIRSPRELMDRSLTRDPALALRARREPGSIRSCFEPALAIMYHGERLNGSTHLIGAVLAATGAAVLVVLAARQGDAWKIVSFSIYGAMLLALYTLSTLYHSTRGRVKDVFRKLDHCSIYLLIAGTYTPFTLVTLRGALGWSLFGTIWGLAILGIVQEAWLATGTRILSVVIYVLMGWLSLVAVKPLVTALTPAGFAWLAAGGLFYTGGIVFYALDEKLRHGHGIWHVFVLAGSASHYLAILLYVA